MGSRYSAHARQAGDQTPLVVGTVGVRRGRRASQQEVIPLKFCLEAPRFWALKRAPVIYEVPVKSSQAGKDAALQRSQTDAISPVSVRQRATSIQVDSRCFSYRASTCHTSRTELPPSHRIQWGEQNKPPLILCCRSKTVIRNGERK